MKAITDRIEFLEFYVRNSQPKDDQTQIIAELAWSTVQELRAIAEAIPDQVILQRGCVCPPTSERTCQAPLCARRGLRPETREAIIKLTPT